MNRKVRQTIEELADLVRKYCNMEDSPMSEDKIISALGGKLSYVDSLGRGVKGLVQKCTDATAEFEILLLNTMDLPEKRFVLCHELGHLFLHMGFMINDELWLHSTYYHKSGYSEEEIEADEFALDILMPARQYRKVLIQNSSGVTANMNAIATFFDVPIDAAINRGRRLGFLEW